MGQLFIFFQKLFDTSDFPPRWHCGNWSAFHGWFLIISDLLIWSAYFAIPLIIVKYISRKHSTRFIRLYFLFAAFIVACGSTHLLDAIIFWYPYYRVSALVKFVTGILSWVTVFYLLKYLPAAFSLKTASQLEAEVEQRKRFESQLEEDNTALREVREQLAQSLAKEKDLNDLKSRFVSIASHEFRTPLSSISSSAYLLSKYAKDEQQPQRDKHIQRIISSVTILNETLGDFLSLEKIELGKIVLNYSVLNIQQVTDSCMQDTQSTLRAGQTFMYEHTGSEEVILDNGMYRHVLTNLLSNASKYSKDNSAIYISTERSDTTIVLKVKDSGIGIPAEDQEHLFKLFYRCSNAAHLQGTGLGLSIVKRYVELMNGTIDFESEVGTGTTFTVTFQLLTGDSIVPLATEDAVAL